MERAEFDQFADEYAYLHRQNIAITGEAPEYFARYKIEALAAILQSAGMAPGRILDFGAGIGNSVPHFRACFPNADLVCADVSQRSLDLAAHRFPGQAASVLIEGDHLPVEDGSCDVTFSACVFHHIAHAEHGRWLRELRRITKIGGHLVIFEHNPLNPLTVRAVNTCPFDANAHLITASHMARRIQDAGWHKPEVRFHVFFPRALASLRRFESSLTWLPLGAQYSTIAERTQ